MCKTFFLCLLVVVFSIGCTPGADKKGAIAIEGTKIENTSVQPSMKIIENAKNQCNLIEPECGDDDRCIIRYSTIDSNLTPRERSRQKWELIANSYGVSGINGEIAKLMQLRHVPVYTENWLFICAKPKRWLPKWYDVTKVGIGTGESNNYTDAKIEAELTCNASVLGKIAPNKFSSVICKENKEVCSSIMQTLMSAGLNPSVSLFTPKEDFLEGETSFHVKNICVYDKEARERLKKLIDTVRFDTNEEN